MTGWLLLMVTLLVLLWMLRESGRRRTALNRALHEVKRPLQALALSVPETGVGLTFTGGVTGADASGDLSSSTVWQAIRAVGDLDRQLNGGPAPARRRELIAGRLLVDASVRRWRSRAHLSGSEINSRWAGPDALLRGDGTALAAALENLILNAIEHGGPLITVNCLTVGRRLRIEVLDNGISGKKEQPAEPPAEARARLRERRRHGHGLRVAATIAGQHGGRMESEFSAEGSRAVLILPVAASAAARRSPVKVNW